MSKYCLFFIALLACVGCGASAGGSGYTPGDNNSPPSIGLPTLPQKSTSAQEVASEENVIYVGYDDTGSTAIKDLLKAKIEAGDTEDLDLVEPHELLNAETFTSESYTSVGLFQLSVGLLPSVSKETGKTLYNLGVHLKGPEIELSDRPAFVLTLLIDNSGSMDDTTGISYGTNLSKLKLVKNGLLSLSETFREGDIINVVLFNSSATVLLENFQYGTTDTSTFTNAINKIKTRGSTNIEAGLIKAYDIAEKYYDAEKKNRVLIITDAQANTGNTSPSEIATNIIINNKEGILISGIGVGKGYDAKFLETLTDTGAGNQFFIATENDADHIFSSSLYPFMIVAAKDMKVKITYPIEFSHIASAAEETGDTADDIKGINFSYNAEQFYLERFKADTVTDLTDLNITVTITYLDPITKEARTENKSFVINENLENESSNIKDALAIIYLTNLIKGIKDWDAIVWEFENVLNGHSSALYSEYRALMYKYAGKTDPDAF